MSDDEGRNRALERLRNARRRPVQLAGDSLVQRALLRDGCELPLVLRPAVDGVDLARWIGAHLPEVKDLLRRHGALLFRGFDTTTPERLEALALAVSGALLPYEFRSTPRSTVQGRIYTSTDYPADQEIPLHNEMSYTSSFPLKIWFACVRPAERGGETPLADSRAVLRDLDPAVREELRARGVMYTRAFHAGLGQSMREVFQTDDRGLIEAYCRRQGIACAWTPEGGLRTRQVRPAVARHPQTGDEVWFNQAHLFHVSALPAPVRAHLASMPEEDLPRHAYFGDGAPIPEAALDAVRAAYARNAVSFPWERGDALLADNLLVAHGRSPYRGARRVIVAMAEEAGDRELEVR